MCCLSIISKCLMKGICGIIYIKSNCQIEKNKKLNNSLNFNLNKWISVHVKIKHVYCSHNRTLSIYNANTDTNTIHVKTYSKISKNHKNLMTW